MFSHCGLCFRDLHGVRVLMHQAVANNEVDLLASYLDIHFHFNGGVAYPDIYPRIKSSWATEILFLTTSILVGHLNLYSNTGQWYLIYLPNSLQNLVSMHSERGSKGGRLREVKSTGDLDCEPSSLLNPFHCPGPDITYKFVNCCVSWVS